MQIDFSSTSGGLFSASGQPPFTATANGMTGTGGLLSMPAQFGQVAGAQSFTATLHGTAQEITVRGIALQLTVSNNKALILAGMERLARTVAVMQRAGTEQPGTYKRRGTVPPPSGSVIVSRRA